VIERGDICWTDFGDADETGHRPAKLRPVLVVQADAYNRSRLATTVVVSLTSNLAAAAKPGNVLLSAADTGLPKDSVVDVTQIGTVNQYELIQPPAGTLPLTLMRAVDAGLAQALGLRLAP
jgi:mRNA interferase MazF